MKKLTVWLVALASMLGLMVAAPSTASAAETRTVISYGYVPGYDITYPSGANSAWYATSGTPGTANATVTKLVFQSDCNWVQYYYDASGKTARLIRVIWSTHTYGRTNCQLAFQRDGNVVIYQMNAQHVRVNPIWASGTNIGSFTLYQFVLQANNWKLIYAFFSNRWQEVWSANFG